MSAEAQVVTRKKYESAIAERDDQIEYLEHQVAKLKQMLFGRRSEKQVIQPGQPFQSVLFSEAEVELAEPEEEETTAPKRKKRGKSKPRFADDAPREVVDIELPKDERDCPKCGEQLLDIGFESSEQAHVIPAQLIVREIRRHKYACRCKKSGVCSAPLPPVLFPKSRVTDETRADIIVQKFVDHIPYYRQSRILRRQGVEISDSTLGGYGIQAADGLAPIIIAMHHELLEKSNLQTDETTIPVLKTEKETPGAHRGYLWGYGAPKGTIIFDYCRTRKGSHPEGFLEGYTGIVQSDRYEGYGGIRRREGIIDIACWAHARRRFIDAEKYAKKRTAPMLTEIRKLYAIEAHARESGMNHEERAALRKKRASPVLGSLHSRLEDLDPYVRPRTPLGDAISYALKHWTALTAYVEYGEAEIDNNLIENSMRPIALGRKNYLFAGSELGAEAAAILYSITESCRRLGINVRAYLVDVFGKLAVADPTDPESIRALTPERWKLAGHES